MNEKLLIDDQVEIIAKKLNIPEVTVKEIIKSYIRLLVEEVHMQMEVRVGYLLRIVPAEKLNNYIATTGYEASVISENLSIPYVTVLSVLTSYLDMVVDAIRSNKNFNIVGLVNIKSHVGETGEIKVYTNISRTLTDRLKEMGKSVRVKLNINLRHLLKEGGSIT
jgi:hypothetical protein